MQDIRESVIKNAMKRVQLWPCCVVQVFGEKDTDGFYRAEICGRRGLIPCNMVSEIQTDDDEMVDQLLKQGFLPLNTPIEKIGMN